MNNEYIEDENQDIIKVPAITATERVDVKEFEPIYEIADFINYGRKRINTADELFKLNIQNILYSKHSSELIPCRPHWEDGTQAKVKKVFGVVNRYDLSKEFPAPTLRPVAFKSCVDEILWIWQKHSNNIKDLKSKVWDQWADEEGSIGKAYGYQAGKVMQTITTPSGAKLKVNQTDYILHCLKHDKNSRRIIANLYNIDELDEMNLHPCCYSFTLNVVGDKLNMLLNQRSSDLIVAGAWNVVQYAVLLHMFAQVSGLQAGELVHVVADTHIYDKHIPIALELLERTSYPAPKLWINPEVKDFYDFTVDDFKLIGYEHNEQIKNIPVAI